jgi:pyridoxal phosphate enzyme (YggS family)
MATTHNPVQARIHAVRERIEKACARAGRSADSVTLVAVSKTFSSQVMAAAADAGQRDFGENYVQEAAPKLAALRARGLVWHFIGPIQSNKTRPIAEQFHWVHSIEREKVARRLSEQRAADLPPLEACIQVNVSGEASKSGVDPQALAALAASLAGLPRLRLRGLMTVPEPTDDESVQRRRFGELRRLKERLEAGGLVLDTLSMGMSGDLEAAIAEGATMVRIGTAIFGPRQ